MKFRGKMTDMMSIRQFAQLFHVLSRCCKQLVIRIAPDKLNFIVCERDARCRNNGATAYCELPKTPYFVEFAMEGLSPADNEIYLEIPADSIASVLHNLRTSTTVTTLKVKLTKKHVPCFTIEIESTSSNANPQLCTHDIPVGMIKRENWLDYKEPELPTFDVSLGMPEFRDVQRSLNRMKNLAPKLTISASRQGKLNFSIRTFTVQSTVAFTDTLKVYNIGEEREEGSQDSNASNEVYSVDVDMKAMLQLIPQENVKPNSFIGSLLHEQMFHLFYIYGDITLQYYLPGVPS